MRGTVPATVDGDLAQALEAALGDGDGPALQRAGDAFAEAVDALTGALDARLP
jgi:hypothetical protein